MRRSSRRRSLIERWRRRLSCFLLRCTSTRTATSRCRSVARTQWRRPCGQRRTAFLCRASRATGTCRRRPGIGAPTSSPRPAGPRTRSAPATRRGPSSRRRGTSGARPPPCCCRATSRTPLGRSARRRPSLRTPWRSHRPSATASSRTTPPSSSIASRAAARPRPSPRCRRWSRLRTSTRRRPRRPLPQPAWSRSRRASTPPT
mmetsp:Transcript_40675/g.115092  ORF Transcript_40675/g.115092 Transcript_40675/m.115092 type:complete len:203 (-) Transcript_40675:383-991(-)